MQYIIKKDANDKNGQISGLPSNQISSGDLKGSASSPILMFVMLSEREHLERVFECLQYKTLHHGREASKKFILKRLHSCSRVFSVNDVHNIVLVIKTFNFKLLIFRHFKIF